MALATSPTRTTDFQAFLAAHPDIESMDCGQTSQPTGFTVPELQIVTQQSKERGWFARIQLNREADPGSNLSICLDTGTYPSGRSWYLEQPQPLDGRDELARYISPDIAEKIYQAEAEHCNDLQYAYQISLIAIQDTVQQAQAQLKQRGAHEKSSQAAAAAQAALVDAAPNTVIAGLFRKVTHQGAVDKVKAAVLFGKFYLATCKLSQLRDINDWHSFTLTPTQSWGAWLSQAVGGKPTTPTVGVLTTHGKPMEVRDLIAGPRISLNSHSSAQLMQLSQLSVGWDNYP